MVSGKFCEQIKNTSVYPNHEPKLMKTEKMFKSLFTSSLSTTTAVTALSGGLAAGGLLGTLFAPDSGKVMRQKIADAFSRLLGPGCKEIDPDSELHSKVTGHVSGKRPKSAIKALTHHVHAVISPSNQGFSSWTALSNLI